MANIEFEHIIPWGTTGGDTGLSSRLKLKRNFERIKAYIDTHPDVDLTLYALKTELQQAVSELEDTIGALDDKFLSKLNDDTANGAIAFLKGLTAGAYHRTAPDSAPGGLPAANSGAAIFPDGTADFINALFADTLKSTDARQGFTDGSGVYVNGPQGLVETDVLNVRRVMRVWELVFNQLQIMHRDYSFTEGAVVERVEPMGNGLYRYHVQSQYDGYVVPMKEGDVIYGIVNNLLEKKVTGANGTAPDDYYTWARIIENGVDLANGTLTVQMYPGSEVPGGQNFTPQGLSVGSAEQQAEGDAYDTTLDITVHGNWLYDVVDGVRTARYPDRQNSWVLSATDKRLSFFWGVDKPIVEDYNYALVLGILPDLANLPTTRNRLMPSLYVNTVFYDHRMEANYQVPPEYRVADMGEWTQQLAQTVSKTATARTDETGRIYITPNTQREVTGARNGLVVYDDGTGQYLTWQVSYQGCQWLCLVDGTTEAPSASSTAWRRIGGSRTVSLGFFTDEDHPVPILALSVRPGHIDETIVPYLLTDQEDTSDTVTGWRWQRDSGNEGLDAAWAAGAKGTLRRLHLTDGDFPTGWDLAGRRVSFTCTATIPDGRGTAVIMNKLTVI